MHSASEERLTRFPHKVQVIRKDSATSLRRRLRVNLARRLNGGRLSPLTTKAKQQQINLARCLELVLLHFIVKLDETAYVAMYAFGNAFLVGIAI